MGSAPMGALSLDLLDSADWRTNGWAGPDPRFVRRTPGRTHGLRSTYTHGCHCPECREAERLYRAERRRRLRR